MRLFVSLVVSLMVLSTQSAIADDECKDVLVNKVMNELKVTKDSYYNTAILSTLNESSDEAEKTDAGLGIVIEGIPISLTYSDARRLKTSLSKYYSLNSIAQERSSYLLMSGQEVIVNAWRDCMRNKGGGLSVRFKPLDGKVGKQTLLLIEYYKPADSTLRALNQELTSDVYIDQAMVQVKAGADCLKAKKVFRPGDTCTVLLITTSAWTTMPIVLLTKTQGEKDGEPTSASYSAYLGPRAELVGATEPWPLKGANITGRTYSFDHGNISPVECFPSSEGYSLLESTVLITARPEGGADFNTCGALPIGKKGKKYIFDQSGKKMCVQQVNGTPAKADHYCSLAITGTEATVKWDPPPPVDPKEVKLIQSFSPAFVAEN